MPYTSNAKEYHQSFLKNKNKKMVNQLKIITQQPKTIQNLNVTDIKSITTEHPKTSRK